MASLGVAVAVYLFIAQSSAKTMPLQLIHKSSLHPTLTKNYPRYLQADGEVSRMLLTTFKSALIRVIKFYRLIKPELKLATCFTRYAGIVQSERSYQCRTGECQGRAMNMKEETEEEEDVTVQKFLRDMVRAMMLFMSDLTPQPVSTVMRMAMEMWKTTRNMYKAVRQDEMGNCSLDYMSKRFWGWIGI